MTKSVTSFSAIAIILGALLHAGAAEAQNARSWVSGAGSDANSCTAASPCLTFAGAYAKTSAGGEIDVLGGGDFGTLTIDHAITIANDGAGTAGITLSGVAAIDIEAASTDPVVLRGLNLNGAGSVAHGVLFHTGASLLIDHCRIEGYQSGVGILFNPLNAASLWVTDTVLSNDGGGYAGIWIFPARAAAITTAHLERVQVLKANGNGIRVDGTGGASAAMDVELRDVTVDGATGGSGIVAVSPASGGPAVKLVADDATVSHNAGYGVRAVGGTASVRLSRSVIEDNGVGIAESSGGVVYSYGDNRFANNAQGDGVAPTPIGSK